MGHSLGESVVVKCADWVFAEDFDVARAGRLRSFQSFDDIIDLVAGNVGTLVYSVTCTTISDVPNCIRPVFLWESPPEVFDAFFNSPAGYRAQFLLSPQNGIQANSALMLALVDRLVAASQRLSASHEVLESQIRKSLMAASAKCWIDETRTFPDVTKPRDLTIELWEASAALAIPKAEWGLRAPIGRFLEAKGAWLDPFDAEIIPLSKAARHIELHTRGYS